jgi:hypothetical protein
MSRFALFAASCLLCTDEAIGICMTTANGQMTGTCAPPGLCSAAKPSFFGRVDGGIEVNFFVHDALGKDAVGFGQGKNLNVSLNNGNGVTSVTGQIGCKPCFCDTLPVTSCVAIAPSGSCTNGYSIPLLGGGSRCVKFGGSRLAASNSPQTSIATPGTSLSGEQLVIEIDGIPQTYALGLYIADENGNLNALVLIKNIVEAVLFVGCGPLVVVNNATPTGSELTSIGPGVFQSVASATATTSLTPTTTPKTQSIRPTTGPSSTETTAEEGESSTSASIAIGIGSGALLLVVGLLSI